MDRQDIDRARVVFAQEGAHLGRAPVIRDRRNDVERLLAMIQRSGRVAIGKRDTALELRHWDDFQPGGSLGGCVVVKCHQAMLAYERPRFLERLAGRLEYLVAGRLLRVGELECRSYGPLLLV